MDLWTVLLHSAQVSVAAFFLLVVQRIFGDKLSPKWRYTIWFVLLVRLVVPPRWGPYILDPAPWVNGLRISVELGLESHEWLTGGLFGLYLLGALACGVWLLLGWGKLRRTLREAVPVEGERRKAVFDWAEEYKLRPPAKIVESQQAGGPFLMGVLAPVLVVPMGWQADKNVVLHELIHLKNRDVAAGWLSALFRCLHWWNPFLWRVFDRVDNQREERCDQQVLERLEGEARRDYGRALLSMAEDEVVRVPGATSMANGAAHIKARIASIAKFKTFPQGMGLVTVCMTLMLVPDLVVGFPSFREPAPALPAFVQYFGPGWQMAWGMSARLVTVAGALDTYSKGVAQNNLAWQAAALPADEYDALWERRNQPALAYDTGPMFRGIYEDGDGGYRTQMYLFRREEDGRIGYHRETLSIRPEAGSWSVRVISQADGLLDDPLWPGEGLDGTVPFRRRWGAADEYCIPIPDKPVFTWTGEYDGVEFEFWPETNLSIDSPHGDSALIQELRLEEFVTSGYHAKPNPAAQFSNCKGVMSGQLTNTTKETKRFTLQALQRADGRVYHVDSNDVFSGMFDSADLIVGYDLKDIEVELAPGECLTFRHGGQGRGRRNGIAFELCLSVNKLDAYYNETQIELKREVNLQ